MRYSPCPRPACSTPWPSEPPEDPTSSPRPPIRLPQPTIMPATASVCANASSSSEAKRSKITNRSSWCCKWSFPARIPRASPRRGCANSALSLPCSMPASRGWKGLGPTSVAHLKTIQAVAARFGRDRSDGEQPIHSSWSQLIDYCRSQMAFESIEQFRILSLDKKNRLIADEVQQTSTVDQTSVYPREVIKRSLELSTTALILVHNHRRAIRRRLQPISACPAKSPHCQAAGDHPPRQHHVGQVGPRLVARTKSDLSSARRTGARTGSCPSAAAT